MKRAIRIVASRNDKGILFAVCPDGPEVIRHYNLAKKSLSKGSSSWISITKWELDVDKFKPNYFDFPTGSLF
jgi:hypothetical protein